MNKMTSAFKFIGISNDQMRKKSKEKYKCPYSIG